MGVASRWSTWEGRGSPVTPGLAVGGSGQPRGVPILQQQFGANLFLSVQIAWGATPTSNMSGWAWTDVTHDVQYQQKIAITVGRPDESTTPQPANLAVTLDNRSGNYSYGPQSVNYPNVTKNVPVRVVVTYNGVSYTRFLGYSTGFTPAWDTSGNYAIVNLTAAGVKRRLGKGNTPVKSVLARSIPTLSGLVEYWPMEDGSTATQLASGIPGGAPMQLGNGIATGLPNLASSSVIAASNAIPVLATGSLFGPVDPTQTATGTLQVRFMAVWPPATSQAADLSEVLSINTPGSSIAFWWLLYRTGGGLTIQGYRADGTLLYGGGDITFNLAGQSQLVGVAFVQSGPDISVTVEVYEINSANAAKLTFTVPGQTLNPCTFVCFAPNGDQNNLAVGHCTVSNTYFGIFNLLSQVNAYNGEYVGTRLDRLASENGEFVTHTAGITQQLMGPQSPDIYLSLMEGCAKVENGFLYDGFAQGLSFIAQDARTSQPAALVLDASLGQIAPPLDPVDDDQIIVNTYTASRTNGSSAIYTDTTSPLAATVIGPYPDSTTQNYFSDSQQISDYASWAVHQGTTPGYRWPAVEIWLHRDPELLAAWLATRLQSRIDLIHLNSVRAQLYNATVSLMLEGYTETIDQFTWSVAANTTPYDPWRVGEIAQETGDTNEFVLRIDSDGANVVTGVPAGSSSLSVSSLDTLWTTNSDDFPFSANIGGQQVTVTNITGSSSPQTFTLDPTTVLYPIPANASVSLWQPCVIDVLAM